MLHQRLVSAIVAVLLAALVAPGAALAHDGGDAAGERTASVFVVASCASVQQGANAQMEGNAKQAKGKDDLTQTKPVPKSIASARVSLPVKKLVFNGKLRTPKPTVKLAGKTLKRNRDYTVVYKRNRVVGLAQVVIVGNRAEGYVGKACATFKIIPRKAALTSVKSPAGGTLKLTAKKVKGAKGYQFRIADNKKMTKRAHKRLSMSRTYTFKRLTEGGRYYVQVRAYTLINGKRVYGSWSAVRKATVSWKPHWNQDGDYYTYLKPNGKLAHGLTAIKGRTYLFDENGRQKTGWQWVEDAYRFFRPANKSGGYMLQDCIVNGIRINAKGIAKPSGAGWSELDIMYKAQKLVEWLTVPTQSRHDKLARGFYYLKDDCYESLTRNFSYYDGWHRAMALDVFDYATGSCFSYGAALAYYANALGYGSCNIISSGGHGWAEINGRVYDAEWSRHCGRDLFNISYDESGYGGTPAYASSRFYVVEIAPHGWKW